VIVGVLLAMVRAHSLGLAHRALRPDCVFLDANHRPKVGGFGVPPDDLSEDPTVARFCAPETSRFASAGLKGDVFSFSLMVYAVAADDPKAKAAKALERLAQGTRSGLPEFLASLVVRGLSRDPGARPRMAEFLSQIEEHNFAILAGADAAAVGAFAAWADDEEPTP
jgi:serine/threonine protein kinase